MSSNPFSDPQANPYAAQPAGAYGPVKPGALTAVCVIAIVLGIMGVLAVCIGGAGLAASSTLQGMLTVGPNATPFDKAQIELQQEMMAINGRYLPIAVVLLGVQLVVSPLLIVGGVKALSMQHSGRRLLIYAFIAVIIFEVVRTAFQLYLQMQMLPLYDEMAMRLAREGGNTPQVEMFQRIGKGSAMFGVVFLIFWGAVKLVLYGLSARYLSLPKTIDVYDEFAAAKPN
jgi:hypothetical protein